MKPGFVNIIWVLLFFVAGLSSCSERLQCAAYSSYFILDNSNYNRLTSSLHASTNDLFPDPSYIIYDNPIRDQYFSYIGEDSMPRTDISNVGKTQYGIAKRKSLRRRRANLGMIPMEVVIPEADDSLRFAGDEQLISELDIQDSTAMDSASMIVKTYKYNVDQKHYNWYFRNKLVWKDELESEEEAEPEEVTEGDLEAQDQDSTGEKEGFFKRIFGNMFKKKQPEPDPAVDEPPVDNEEDKKDGF